MSFLAVQQFILYLVIAMVMIKKVLKLFMRGAKCVHCFALTMAGFDFQPKIAGMGSSTALPLGAYCKQPE